MKRLIVASIVLCLGLSAFAQSPTADAKAKLVKERYEARVEFIKEKLKEKEKLQARIAEIDQRIKAVEDGEVPPTGTPCNDCYITYSSPLAIGR